MALSFVGSYASGHNATSAQSIALSNLRNSSNVQPTLLQNDLIIVTVVHASATGNSRTNAQLTPTGYTAELANSVVATTTETHVCSLGVFYKFMGSTPDTTISIPACALTTNAISYTIEVWRGANTTNPLPVTPTTASAINTGLANPPSITTPSSPTGSVVIGCFGAAVAAASVFANSGGTQYDSTTNVFKSAAQNVGTNRAVSGMGAKTGLAISTAFDAAITGSTTTNTGSWCAASIVLVPAPDPPTITSSANFNIPENSIFSQTLTADETVTWSKIAYAESADFTLSSGGLLTLPAKDYEGPTDSTGDGSTNTYQLIVRATSTATGLTADQIVTVTVTDVFEPTYPCFDPTNYLRPGGYGGCFNRQRYFESLTNLNLTIEGSQGGDAENARVVMQPAATKWQIEFVVDALGSFGGGQSIRWWVDEGLKDCDANGGINNIFTGWTGSVVGVSYGGPFGSGGTAGVADWFKDNSAVGSAANWPVFAVGDRIGMRGNKTTGDVEFYHLTSSSALTSLLTLIYTGSVMYAGVSCHNGASKLTLKYAAADQLRPLDSGYVAYDGSSSGVTRKPRAHGFFLGM